MASNNNGAKVPVHTLEPSGGIKCTTDSLFVPLANTGAGECGHADTIDESKPILLSEQPIVLSNQSTLVLDTNQSISRHQASLSDTDEQRNLSNRHLGSDKQQALSCNKNSPDLHKMLSDKQRTPPKVGHPNRSQGSSERSYKRALTPEEFDFETRYVVLNFLGIVPVSGQSFTSSRTSSSEGNPPQLGSQASLDSSKSGVPRHVKAESGEWGALPKLPEMSIVEKFREYDTVDYATIDAGMHRDILVSASKRKSTGRWHHTGETTDQTAKQPMLGSVSDSQIGLSSGERSVHVDVEDDSDSLPEPSRSCDFAPIQPITPDDFSLAPRIKREVENACDDGVVLNSRHLEVEVKGSNVVHESIDKTHYSMHVSNGMLSRDLTMHAQRHTVAVSDLKNGTGRISEQPGSSPMVRHPGYYGDMDEVDALPWPDDDESPVTHDAHSKQYSPSPAAQRPTSIAISKHVYPVTPPAPPPAYKSKSPGKRQKTPLTKSNTIGSEKSSISSRPEYTWQASHHSESSSFSENDSLMLSTRSSTYSHIDITPLDVETMTPLVECNALPSLVFDLKHELDEQMLELEHKSGSSLHSVARSMSPESQIAAYLCQIGDRVQASHGELLERAFQTVTSQPQEDVGYDEMRNAAGEMTQGVTGVTKVALLLLLGKRLTYNLLSRGDRGINKVVDYTARLIEDQAADFIVEQGGWNSIKDLDDDWSPMRSVYDIEQGVTPDNPDSTGALFNPLPGIEQVGSEVSITTATMTESYHSEASDTTLVSEIKERDPSLDTLSSLTTVSEASPADSLDNMPFKQYNSPSGTSLDEKPRSRHSSGNSARRGSFNFIPYPDHVVCGSITSSTNEVDTGSNSVRKDSKNSLNGAANGSNIVTESSKNNSITTDVFNDEPTMQRNNPDAEVDFCTCADGCESCCAMNHTLVEGTLDVDISRDVMLLRQLSKELAEESQLARERESFYDHMTTVVAIIAVVVVGGIFLYKKK